MHYACVPPVMPTLGLQERILQWFAPSIYHPARDPPWLLSCTGNGLMNMSHPKIISTSQVHPGKCCNPCTVVCGAFHTNTTDLQLVTFLVLQLESSMAISLGDQSKTLIDSWQKGKLVPQRPTQCESNKTV